METNGVQEFDDIIPIANRLADLLPDPLLSDVMRAAFSDDDLQYLVDNQEA